MMDNCVGKHTLRYFVQYSSWMSVLLIVAISLYIKAFYCQNAITGKGVKCITELRPYVVIFQILCMMTPLPSEFYWIYWFGELRDDHRLFVLDNCLITFSVGFLLFA